MGTGHAVRVIRTDTGEFWPTISEAATKMNVSIGRLSKARAADLSEVAGIPIRFEETNSNWNALEVQDLETGMCIGYFFWILVAPGEGLSEEAEAGSGRK